MKRLLFIGAALLVFWSCEKSTPPTFTNKGGNTGTSNSGGDGSGSSGSGGSTLNYGGSYAGVVNARLVFAGWNYNRTQDSIVKNDTTFDFTVKVNNLGNNEIFVHTPD